MEIDKPRCDLTSCRNYFDGNCTRGYEMCDYPKYKAVNEKIKYEGYTLCKVDEVVEKTENAKFDSTEKFCYAFNDGLSTAIEILKEVCK